MLINTNQLISLTQLRLSAGKLLDQTQSGKTFIVMEKGKIKGAIVPASTVLGSTTDNFFTKMDALRKKFSKIKFADNRDSTQIIREMRDERSQYLLKRDGSL